MSTLAPYGTHGFQIVSPEPLAGTGGQALNDDVKVASGLFDNTFTTLTAQSTSLTNLTTTVSNNSTTLGNATSAATANTLVKRDGNADFAARTITTTSITGNGSALTSLNAGNITTGTIANSHTTGWTANVPDTLVLRDNSGSIAAQALTLDGDLQASGSITGDGIVYTSAGFQGPYLTSTHDGTHTNLALDADAITLPNASVLTLTDNNGGGVKARLTASGSLTLSGNLTSTIGTLTGNGSGLTSLNASNITTGTLNNARLSGVALTGSTNTFSADQVINTSSLLTNVAALSVRGNNSGAVVIEIKDGQFGNVRATIGQGGDLNCAYANSIAGAWQIADVAIALGSAVPIQWSSTTFSSGTKDVGVTRNAAGELKITDGASGNGALNVGKRVYAGVTTVTVSAAGTVTPDASLGNLYQVVANGSFTVAAPSNATNGQRLSFKVRNTTGSAITLTPVSTAGGFAFGTDVPSLTAVAANKSDLVTTMYDAENSRNKWLVLSQVKGF
jgi:hypothetical protein